MVDNNAFYKYVENRGQAGYKAAFLVKEQGETKYSMLVASETVPSIFGSQNSFEFDLLNSPVTGKIAGKISLEDKDVQCLLHRDNVYRFEQLKGKVLDFLYLTPDFVGWKIVGTITFKPDDATADTLRGTYTISPMSADDTPFMECRDMVQETLCFAGAIPEHATAGDKVNLGLVQSVSATYTTSLYDKEKRTWGTETTLTVENGVATLPDTAGLYAIKASATGYSSWTTTIYVAAKA